jgi:hypothetical protein
MPVPARPDRALEKLGIARCWTQVFDELIELVGLLRVGSHLTTK